MSMSLGRQRFAVLLMTLFAILGVFLASVGTYGVVSYVVSLRTREIGIRMALGAERRDVLRMMIGNGIKPAFIGVIVGVGGAFALTRLFSSMLFGVSPRDPLTFVGVAIALMVVTLCACYIPARRATRVDPMVALRHE